MFGLTRGATRGKNGRDSADPGRDRMQLRTIQWGVERDAGRVVAKAGLPILLMFHRTDSDQRSDCVSIPALGRFSTISPRSCVELPPCAPGEYALCRKDGTPAGVLVVQA
jgi:hypothetical protein